MTFCHPRFFLKSETGYFCNFPALFAYTIIEIHRINNKEEKMSEQMIVNEQPTPGKVQAISIIMLVNGILNVLAGLSITGAAILSIIGVLCLPVAVLPLVLGIFEVIYAARLLSNKPVEAKTIKTLAILEIANILYANVLSVVAGILNLVFLDDPQVKTYLQ